MSKALPYCATTATGESFEIAFPLHTATVSPSRVHQMLTATLAVLDREVRLDPDTSNGDVLQALAMALSVRAGMIAAPKTVTDHLVCDLIAQALHAVEGAERRSVQVGHA
jgi:hypothetical protein